MNMLSAMVASLVQCLLLLQVALWCACVSGAEADPPSRFSDELAKASQFLAQGNRIGAFEIADGLLTRAKYVPSRRTDLPIAMRDLANRLMDYGYYREAEPLYRAVLEFSERIAGPDSEAVATSANNLGLCCLQQERYSDAEALLKRSLQISERRLGPTHRLTAVRCDNLAVLHQALGRFNEAEMLQLRALRILASLPNASKCDEANVLGNLASVQQDKGSAIVAERAYQHALEVFAHAFGEDAPETAHCLMNLSVLYEENDRYAEAESACQNARRVLLRTFPADHPRIASCNNSLGAIYWKQGRYREAEANLKAALNARQKCFGPGHSETAVTASNLSVVYLDQGRITEAANLLEETVEVLESEDGPVHPLLAGVVLNLATCRVAKGDRAAAEGLYRRALEIREKSLPDGSLSTISSLEALAGFYLDGSRIEQAEPLIERAVALIDRHEAAPPRLVKQVYMSRADLKWKTNRREDAVSDLEVAMQQGDALRTHASGVETDRARAFSQHVGVYERMVAYQTQLRDAGKAFVAMESCRAQGLQDLMRSSNIDLLQNVPEPTATALREAESRAQAELAAWEKQFEVLRTRADMNDDHKVAEAKRLEEELGTARQRLVQAWANIKNASPAYRLVVSEDREPVRLATLRKELDSSDTVALQYMLGKENGYLLAYGGGREPTLTALHVSPAQAETLGSESGPLTSARAQQILLGSKNRHGLLQGLTDLRAISVDGLPAKSTLEQLRTFWSVLVPDESLREHLLDGKSFKRLLILPDGALARLPFEALLVGDDPADPEYLLDRGPATVYAPSATVFHNLKHRRNEASSGTTLTVGNPDYGARGESEDRGGVLDGVKVASRFASLGKLSDLPWTGDESRWIKETCEAKGLPVLQLTKEAATEANVRESVGGRSMVHFACHGLADDSYGNLFGALALTPVDAGDPSDDGFLTVAEMFNLNLKGCELAILSACDTNIGPNQRGEGTWSMCRGMLTSGARRVITTDWQVADEASAHLVYALVYYLHESEAGQWDYATSLRDARLSIRQHEENAHWHHPYFWAPFVLMGPE